MGKPVELREISNEEGNRLLRMVRRGAGNIVTWRRSQIVLSTLDWSYDLLDEPEQTLFRRLGVFEGGFTCEAVEAMWEDDRLLDSRISELLSRLVDSSLVMVDFESSRYRMLETISDYASRRLTEAGEAEEVARGHAVHFTRFAEHGPKADIADRGAWNRQLRAEVDNLRAALTWSLDAGEDSIALGLGSRIAGPSPTRSATWPLLWGIGEGSFWMERLLRETEPSPTPERAEILSCATVIARYLGDVTVAHQHGAELRDLAVTMGDDRYLAIAMARQSINAKDSGDLDEAERLGTEAIRILRELDDPFLLIALNSRALSLVFAGRLDEADAIARELVDRAEHCGDLHGKAAGLLALGFSRSYRGADPADAATHIEHGREILQQLGATQLVSEAWLGSGWVALAQGRLEQARTCANKSLGLLDRREGPERGAIFEFLARVEQARGNSELALALIRKALGLYRGRPDARALFVGSTVIVLADHDPGSAAQMYGAYLSECERLGVAAPALDKVALEGVVSALRADLGADAFEEAVRASAGIPPDQLVPQLLDMVDRCASRLPHSDTG